MTPTNPATVATLGGGGLARSVASRLPAHGLDVRLAGRTLDSEKELLTNRQGRSKVKI